MPRHRYPVARQRTICPEGLHKLLTEDIRPATDLFIVIGSVDAALYPPVLSHRHLPWESDLNRCFSQPIETDQCHLAQHILQELRQRKPEAVLDTHNTSAHSQAFTISTIDTPAVRQLSSQFAGALVIFDQHWAP